ncbi:hypothetical protein HU200_028235 [Digitaria exilis]|uniref:Uncharacterized protein n=1 Tax=Digitaria exilis TaxID=1010633 RepID=A0A835BUY2_9POAL|nr:hypothetical protein HU200_028235 [Digitaria exilis]
MNRRFVNLVLVDYDTRIHSLFRLDVAKHLFYPSTAQAETANAKQETNNGGGGGGDNKSRKPPRLKWPKLPRFKWLGRLLEPCMRFFQYPPADDGDEEPEPPWRSYEVDAFMLLRPGCSDGTILHATNGGRTVIYDADKNAICATVPFFDTGMGGEPVVFSIPGAGSEEKERLYVMRSTFASPVHHYDHRRYYYHPRNNDEDDEDHRCSGDFVVLDFNQQQPYKWQHLPRPAFVVDKGCSAGSHFRIRSSAVVDGGRTIVVSADESSNGYSIKCSGGVEFTYWFDTATRQWRHAGDWALPFSGRAEYVPELNTWIGLSSTSPHHLCAIDLSSAMDAGDRAPPTPHHVWDDFTLPVYEESSAVLNRHHPQYVLQRSTEWWPEKHSLVNLGSGRFCTLKVFFIRRRECVGFYEPDMDKPDDEEFAVLTGVEVVRCHDGEEEGGLRMVKHKSKRCVLDHDHCLF